MCYTVYCHRIHRSPPGRERIIHPCPEVEQGEVKGTETLGLLAGISPAVVHRDCRVGRILDLGAERQVIILLQDLRGRQVGRDVDYRPHVSQMIPGKPAVPSLSQAYFKELPCIPALSTKLGTFQRNSKPFRPGHRDSVGRVWGMSKKKTTFPAEMALKALVFDFFWGKVLAIYFVLP